MNVNDFMAKHGITDADLDRMAAPYEDGSFEPEPDGKVFGDEEHFIYVDSSKDDGGELGRLMHDFRVKEAKEMQTGALKDRVHELKETEKGVEHMCKEMEALRLEGVEEGRLEEKRENAKSMAEDGMTVDRIAKILKVNAQMVQEWLAGSVSTAR